MHEDLRLWITNMQKGNFADAWKISDAALMQRKGINCSSWPRHLQFIWDGSPLNGKKVLVRCYHGLGDTIQFIRYMPLLKSIASEVMIWVQPVLVDLIKTVPRIDRILPLHDGSPDISFDTDVEIMEFPHIFRSSLDTIPKNIPYIFPEPLAQRTNYEFSVGIIWKAGEWDDKRSIPLELISSLANVSGIKFFGLQKELTKEETDAPFFFVPERKEPYSTAQFMLNLDLIISVDSMPAHLAGALGIPVWLLLNKDADWRWMKDRTDSCWYPTMKIFRQEAEGDWEPVINRVTSALLKTMDQPVKRKEH